MAHHLKTPRKEYPTLPKSAPLARMLGLAFYFTGRECKHGHVAPRRVINHQCRDCHRKAMDKVNKRALKKLRQLYGK